MKPDEELEVFNCTMCGDCCYGRGGVRLTEAEAAEAADYLRLSLADLKRLYLGGGEPPWEARVDLEGYCMFRHPGGAGCIIHPVKPAICRLWPFLPGPLKDESAFNDAKAACPGLADDLNWADFKAAWAAEQE
ncbi:MAG: YkgJ family cysteine cluster protein [Candidatus Adiutrix sp.]|jgi:Fe-S-cluster containining protein|nr:YkgJ family cysteine cluster protein [Candidatus Adiutrix sp.]